MFTSGELYEIIDQSHSHHLRRLTLINTCNKLINLGTIHWGTYSSHDDTLRTPLMINLPKKDTLTLLVILVFWRFLRIFWLSFIPQGCECRGMTWCFLLYLFDLRRYPCLTHMWPLRPSLPKKRAKVYEFNGILMGYSIQHFYM